MQSDATWCMSAQTPLGCGDRDTASARVGFELRRFFFGCQDLGQVLR